MLTNFTNQLDIKLDQFTEDNLAKEVKVLKMAIPRNGRYGYLTTYFFDSWHAVYEQNN